MSVQYWIAQHIDDPFRNEPRNVGVIVRLNGEFVARFFGEQSDGTVDGRRLRGLRYPDVYKQWLSYWRAETMRGAIENVVALVASNYRVIPGGEVTDTGSDSVGDIANYLYSMLVSEGGFREALSVLEDSAEPVPLALNLEVSDALDQAQLLLADERREARVPHPVRRGSELMGRLATPYRPAFTQENGRLYVMETVDFTRGSKKASRDHAGWSAYMFHDIREARVNSESIAIVKVTDAERDIEEVRGGLALLGNEGRIVNWADDTERAGFLDERRAVAFS
jgi:hypothetical protein